MIEVEKLAMTYGTVGVGSRAVDDVSFRVERGQFYTLLGPSGCGKTTTLRSVAGLERPDSGEIRIDGAPVSSSKNNVWVPPNARGIGMVFQSYAIWPHMTVFENVAFPLRYGRKKFSADDIKTRVHRSLEQVQLGGYADRPAPNLSGGQQQRLALARAFAMEPKVLLLDEPLSNLDAKLREEMRGELRHLVKSMGVTTIFVTHEQIEALTLSDVIAVMKDGKIVQEGAPLDIYRQPVNAFVADFIGRSNLVQGRVVDAVSAHPGAACQVSCDLGQLRCVAPAGAHAGDVVSVAIRPEHFELVARGDAGENAVQGTLETASFIGNQMECSVRVGNHPLKVLMHPERTPSLGGACTLYVTPAHCLALRH